MDLRLNADKERDLENAQPIPITLYGSLILSYLSPPISYP